MEFEKAVKAVSRYIYTKDTKPSLFESLSTAHDWELKLYYDGSDQIFKAIDYRRDKGEDWIEFKVPATLRYKMRINIPANRTHQEDLTSQGQRIPDGNM